MTTLSSKADIQKLLQAENFTKILLLDRPASLALSHERPALIVDEYYPDPESDHGPSGAILFNTAQITNSADISSYLQVVKLYGQPELPFRVLGVEIWDEHEGISISSLNDVRTLAEALDYAFSGHDLDTFTHADITGHLQGSTSSLKQPSLPGLQCYEAGAEADRVRRAERKARMAAPIQEAEIAEIMSIAQASGLALDGSFDTALQMNRELFGSKAEAFVLFTAELDEDGSRNEIAVLSIQDKTGALTYFDIDGTAKTGAQVMESYTTRLEKQMFAKYPQTKADGLVLGDFIEVMTKKASMGELISEAELELSQKGEQHSEAQQAIANAVQSFLDAREAKFQAAQNQRETEGPSR